MNDLRLMESFVAVYKYRSFRTAAESLGVSQSSVTKRVQMLEQQLGLRLFNRTTRAVEPTDLARQLIPSAEDTTQTHATFQKEARLLAEGELGAIRVGAIALAAETTVVRGLALLTESHPNLSIEVIVGSSDTFHDLVTGGVDVVVADEANFESSPHAHALRKQHLHREQLVYVHRPEHPAANTHDPDMLFGYPLAIPSRYFTENRLFETLATRTDPPIHPRYKLNSLSACLNLAASSNAVALAPRSLIQRTRQTPQSAPLCIAELDTGIEVSIVMLTLARHTPTPGIRAFAAAMIRALRVN